MNTPTQINRSSASPAGNGAIGDAIGNGHRNRALRGSEHLHRLFGAFDGDFVEHHGVGFAQQVWRNDS